MRTHQPPIRILIADDHPLIRDGLRRLFDLQPGLSVVGEAADGAEALQKLKALRPDILLLDVAMPRMDGLDVLRTLAGGTTQVRTILLTASIESEEAVQALRLGARGVVLKESATEQLYKCIHAVMKGEYWIGHERIGDVLHALLRADRVPPESASPASTLTPRERQVIAAVVEGASNKDIGKTLGLSEQTVKNHLSNIYDKLGVSTRLELALYAVHHRLPTDAPAGRAPAPQPSAARRRKRN
jgi:DNA-binding NarL/FixJ family response regulator